MIHVEIYLKVLLISVCLEVTRMWYILYDEVFSRSWEKGGEKAKERERWSRCDGRGDELDDPLFTRIHRCAFTNNLVVRFREKFVRFSNAFCPTLLPSLHSSLSLPLRSCLVPDRRVYNTDSVNNRARVSRRLRSFFSLFSLFLFDTHTITPSTQDNGL